MYILGIRADKVDEDLIKRLIDNQVQENKSLDYKRDLNISKDKDKKEFLYDISAMYNTDGGCFVFGIEELKDTNGQNTGKPDKITGIVLDNFDKLTQQIEDIVKNSSEPSITQLILNELEIDTKKILIIGVPKGLGLPAMVTYNQTNKFYKRRNSGKFPVDVYELNQMFMQNQVLAEKANDFRNNRLDKVLKKEFLPNLKIDTSYFIHIIPYSFLDSKFVNLSLAKEKLKLEIPELPDEKKKRFIEKFKLSPYEATILVSDNETSNYFENVIKKSDVKLATNWIIGELFAALNEKNLEITQSPISAGNLSKLINLIKDGTISGKIAKTVFDLMADGDQNPQKIIEEKDLKQQSDPKELEKLIEKVITDNPEKVKEYKSGKEKLFGFFVGQIMKSSGGKANPQLVNDILKKKL